VQAAELDDESPEVEAARKVLREEQTTGSLDELPDVMERAKSSASPVSDAALQKAAQLEFEDRFSDEHVRAAIVGFAKDLAANPREIKRFINVFRFYAYVDFWRQTSGLTAPGREGAAKLARLAIGWPHLLSELGRDHPTERKPLLALLEQAAADDEAWAIRVASLPERVKPDLQPEGKLRALLKTEPKVGETSAGFV
jgi:hypothetical protein